MQRLGLWPLSLRQSSNQLPCAIHHEHAAIIAVLLRGHSGSLQSQAQPFCEPFCGPVIVSLDGIVMIGDRHSSRAAIYE